MRYETSIDSTAAPERIWATWVDMERWPEWTKSVQSAKRLDDGEFRVGSRTRFKQPMMLPMVWEVTEMSPGHSFLEETRTAGTRLVAGHYLEPNGSGGTTVRVSIDVEGPLAGALGLMVGGRIRRYLQMEADGIKRHCEAQTP